MSSLFESNDATEFIKDLQESQFHDRDYERYLFSDWIFTLLQIDFNFTVSANSIMRINGRHGIETPLPTAGLHVRHEFPAPGDYNRAGIYGNIANTTFSMNNTAVPGQGIFTFSSRGGADGTLYNLLKDFGYTNDTTIPAPGIVVPLKLRWTYHAKNGIAVVASKTVDTYYTCTAFALGKATLNPQ